MYVLSQVRQELSRCFLRMGLAALADAEANATTSGSTTSEAAEEAAACLALLDQAIGADPKSPSAHFARGTCLHRIQGDFDGAEDSCVAHHIILLVVILRRCGCGCVLVCRLDPSGVKYFTRTNAHCKPWLLIQRHLSCSLNFCRPLSS